MTARLLLVYNADAGIIAGLFDLAHKIVSPATYPCSLCGVTYGPLGMDRRWRAWLQALPFEIAFFHLTDFRESFPAHVATPLPLIARDDDGVVTVILDAAALKAIPTVDGLIAALQSRLA